MKKQQEQISEEFAKILANNIYYCLEPSGCFDSILSEKETLLNWKEKGYIKQSREEKLRQEIEEYINSSYYVNGVTTFIKNKIDVLLELIEILDNKIKGN